MSKDTNYTVIDNFLSNEKFNLIHNCLTSDNFPWYFQSNISFKNDKTQSYNFYMTHRIYDEERPLSNHFELIKNTLLESIYVKSLIRIKANLYLPSRGKEVYHHAKHRDGVFKHQGALFYLTNCDAPTTMDDGYEVQSVENRLLLFDATSPHSSSSPTNSSHRVTINFNYWGAGVRMEWRHNMPNPNPIISKNMELLEKSHFLDIANQAMTEWGI